MTDSLQDVVAFLLGEGSLDGVWFGDKPAGERGQFWWRKQLRAASLSALAAPVVSSADRRDAERYRWLRISANVSWNGYITYENLVAEESERQMMDRAIDNAISPERSGEAS